MVTLFISLLYLLPVVDAPVVEWLQSTEYDFGTMVQGVPTSIDFEFRNTGEQAVVLQTVRTTCGCTAANWTEEPVMPGQTGKVRIEYDAYQKGAFSKKIRVFFDQQRKPEILWIHGVVE